MHFVVEKSKPATACSHCRLAPTCLPAAISLLDQPVLEQHIHQLGPLSQGQHLFRAGNPAHELFIVKSGCFKLYGVDSIGREYIPGFRLPGEVLGVHGFKIGTHRYNARALTNATVCRMSSAQLTELAACMPGLLPAIFRLFSQEVVSHVFLTGSLSAEERVSAFLSNLESRLPGSLRTGDLYLPMSRNDIAVYLRLAPATVSRILSRLEREGIIACEYRDIHILDHGRLNHLCENVPFTFN